MSNVSIRDLGIAYGKTSILEGLNLDIQAGEFIVLLGPSGCGKSTLLHSIAGLIDVTTGQIEIGGTDVTWADPKDRGIGMVFQSYALCPTMTVERNLSFGLRISGMAKPEIAKRVDNAARMLQLTELLNRKPSQLSGGQRQRVAIGRALVREAKVFLLDEPLSNLDAKLRAELRRELKQLHVDLGATMVYVTHDQVEAMTLADRIVVLNKGNIEQVGTPLELYDHPANEFVAQFIGSPKMNLIPASLVQAGETESVVRLDNGKQLVLPISTPRHAEGQSVNLGIRPEHILWGKVQESQYQANVMFVEHMGNETYLYLDNGNASEPWVVRNAERSVISAGQTVGVQLPVEHCYLFDGDGNAFQRLIATQNKH